MALRCVVGPRLRPSEELMIPMLELIGLDLPIPDHTALSRRARTCEPSARWQWHPEDGPLHVLVDSTGLKVFYAGQWLEDRHDARSRRDRRKLRLALNADSDQVGVHRLTDQVTGNLSQVGPLLDRLWQARPPERNEADQNGRFS